MTIKDSKFGKIYSAHPLYLIFSKVNGYLEENNGNKYLGTVVPTKESKKNLKVYKELWIRIRDLISLITKNLDDYDESYMKMKFNLDDELPIIKMIENPSMKIVVTAVFHENN